MREGATIVHCSAGKDRTGRVASCSSARRPARAIVEDYALTNTAWTCAQLLGATARVGLAATAEPILACRHRPDAVLAAHPSTSRRAWMPSRHATAPCAYLLDELAIEPAVLDRLRERLLD